MIKKIDRIEKTTTRDSLTIDIDSSITAFFIKNTNQLIAEKNLCDYYEFVFKNETKLFPKITKINQILKERDKLFEYDKELKIKQQGIKNNHCCPIKVQINL